MTFTFHFVTLWTIACQAPLSMGLNGLPYPPPGDVPNPGNEPMSHISCIGTWFLLLLTSPGKHKEVSKSHMTSNHGKGKAWDVFSLSGNPEAALARIS